MNIQYPRLFELSGKPSFTIAPIGSLTFPGSLKCDIVSQEQVQVEQHLNEEKASTDRALIKIISYTP